MEPLYILCMMALGISVVPIIVSGTIELIDRLQRR